MNLQQLSEYMQEQHNAYWVSFYIDRPDKKIGLPKTRIEFHNWKKKTTNKRAKYEIVQIDSYGISRGNESHMIDLVLWVEEIGQTIEVTSKMLGSDLDHCLYVIKALSKVIHTCYCSV